MANKTLDYGSHEGQELFNTDTPYSDAEPRWAARGNWFIRFWGYIFTHIARSTTVNQGSNRSMLFVDSDNGKLTMRTGDVYQTFETGERAFSKSKKYVWFNI